MPTTPELPDELRLALSRDAAAAAIFTALPPSHQREYTQWIAAAKKPETRATRAAKTLDRLRAKHSA